jgi:drug/metabolite transporter (DMT)-like permease
VDTPLLLAALLSAFLHAAWTAAVKHSGQPTEAMTGQMMVAGLIGLALFWALPPPSWAIWPYLLGSVGLNLVALLCLLNAYDRAPFGAVYPLSRATMVLIVAPVSTWWWGERISPFAWAGVMCIAAALVLMAWEARHGQTLKASVLGWTVLGGVISAVAVMVDVQGIRVSESPMAYGCLCSFFNGLTMLLRQRRRPDLLPALRRHRGVVLGAGMTSMTSYLLIVWVFAQAPLAISAALRDTSAVFAVLISIFIMKERVHGSQRLAIFIAACAVPLLRL